MRNLLLSSFNLGTIDYSYILYKLRANPRWQKVLYSSTNLYKL